MANWLRRAEGCSNASIGIAEDGVGVRLWKTSRLEDYKSAGDPILDIQAGLPVMYLNRRTKQFERRVLKTDDRLVFLFVLYDDCSSAAEGTPMSHDPIIFRVRQIEAVLFSHDALQLCKLWGVENPHLNLGSAVVVQVGDVGAEHPSFRSVLIFMAPPQQGLPQCLEAVRRSPPDHVALQEEQALLRGIQGKRRVKSKGMGLMSACHLDAVVFPDARAIWDASIPEFIAELELMPDGRVHTAQIPTDIEASQCVQTAARLREELSLTAVDAARFTFALRDMIALRHWATKMVPSIFTGTLHRFLYSGFSLDEAMGVSTAQAASRHVDINIAAMRRARVKDVDAYYGQAAVRAAHVALRHLLELEAAYSECSTRCMAPDQSPGHLPVDDGRLQSVAHTLKDRAVADALSLKAVAVSMVDTRRFSLH